PPEGSAAPAAAPAPQGRARAEGQRIGILLDFAALSAEAQRQGGELSFRKLLRGIAGDRPVIRALCFLGAGAPATAAAALAASGFEVLSHGDGETAAVTMAVEAMALAPRIDVLVLAPAGRTMASLVQVLSSRGLQIEAANFDGTAPAGTVVRRLGRECIF